MEMPRSGGLPFGAIFGRAARALARACPLLECKACLAGIYKQLRTFARQALHSIRA